MELDFEGLGAGGDLVSEGFGVEVALVGEACSPAFAECAYEGIYGGGVDVVGDYHEVAGIEGLVDAAGGIGEEESFDAEAAHYFNGHYSGSPACAFVVVAATAEDDGAVAFCFDETDFAGMTLDGAVAVAGDGGEGEAVDAGASHDGATPAGAEDYAEGGFEAVPGGGDGGGGFVKIVGIVIVVLHLVVLEVKYTRIFLLKQG